MYTMNNDNLNSGNILPIDQIYYISDLYLYRQFLIYINFSLKGALIDITWSLSFS